MSDKRPRPFLSSSILFLILAPSATGAQTRIRVLDELNHGVDSALEISTAGNNWRHLAYTNPPGVALVPLTCQVGNRLRAVPRDSATYFHSQPQDCAARELRVAFRQQGARRAASVSYTQFRSPTGDHNYVLLLRRYAGSSRTQNVVPSPLGGSSVQCQYTISASLDRMLYERTEEGDWRAVDASEVASWLPALPHDEVVQSGTLPASCDSAEPRITAAERVAMLSHQSRLGDVAARQAAALLRRYRELAAIPGEVVE